MIALIDYDAGNMKSVEKALQLIGEDVLVTRDPKEILAADKVVLPGVGSFGDAMENLHHFGLVPVIHQVVQEKTPFLGICLGLQLLFEKSEESPGVEGLGILKGEILRIPAAEGLKIPHMGWNNIRFPNKGRLFAGVPEDAYVYFVHSYYLKAQDEKIVTATTEYGTHIHASVESGNLFGGWPYRLPASAEYDGASGLRVDQREVAFRAEPVRTDLRGGIDRRAAGVQGGRSQRQFQTGRSRGESDRRLRDALASAVFRRRRG